MNKKWIFVAVALLASLIILFLATRVTYPPERPAGVDQKAEWAGGRDGGAWVNCEAGPELKNTFLCTVFSDDGERMRAEMFELRETETHGSVSGNDFAVKYNSLDKVYGIDELRLIGFSSYDGTKIRLTNNYVLIPIRELK